MSEDVLYDVVIVGAGGSFGSSTLYHLAARGLKVLGLESQATAPHTFGSHHGDTRITRLSYFEDPRYVALLRRSFELWEDLEREGGEPVFLNCGCVSISSPDASGSALFDGALASAEEHGLAHEVLTPSELEQRFPALRTAPGSKVFHESAGGVLFPTAVIGSYLRLARDKGADFLTGARVRGWEVGGGDTALPRPPPADSPAADGPPGAGVPAAEVATVTLEDGRRFSGRKLVLTPGAWLPGLVPELKALLRVERQVIAWFRVEAEVRESFSPARLPVQLIEDSRGDFYAFPADARGYKIGLMDYVATSIDPDGMDRSVVEADLEPLRGAVAKFTRGCSSVCEHAAACLFTSTPDHHFLVDFHPRHPGTVVLASPCSGHGFKFVSVLGEALAQMAADGRAKLDLGLFAFDPAREGHTEALQAFGVAEGGR